MRRAAAPFGSGVGRRSLLELHVLDRDRQVAAEQFDRRLVFLVEAVRVRAFDTQDADELAAHEQRDAELAVRLRQSWKRNPLRGDDALFVRALLHGERIEHLADQPGDADWFARFGHHADDAFAQPRLGADAHLGIAAAGDGDVGAFFDRGHQNHRVLESEARLESFEDRVEQPLERIGAMDPRREILKRLHREDRIDARRSALRRHLPSRPRRRPAPPTALRRCRPPSSLKMPLRPEYDAIASMRSAIRSKTGPDGFRSDVAQLQPPALARVGVDQPHQRLRVLGDVALALVEELERQRDVRGIDVVHVAEERRVRRAVLRAGEERRRDEPLEARGHRLEAEPGSRSVGERGSCTARRSVPASG